MQVLTTTAGRKIRVNKSEVKLLKQAAALVKEIGYQSHDSGLQEVGDELETLSRRFSPPQPQPETKQLFETEEVIAAGADGRVTSTAAFDKGPF